MTESVLKDIIKLAIYKIIYIERMPMIERIEILHDNKVIGDKAYDMINKIHEKHLEKNNFTQETLDLFLTHLAMALERTYKGEEIEYLDDSILNELKKADKYQEAKDFWRKIKDDFSINLAASEECYLYLHLVNILNNEED